MPYARSAVAAKHSFTNAQCAPREQATAQYARSASCTRHAAENKVRSLFLLAPAP